MLLAILIQVIQMQGKWVSSPNCRVTNPTHRSNPKNEKQTPTITSSKEVRLENSNCIDIGVQAGEFNLGF
jgi:hypothetical protein